MKYLLDTQIWLWMALQPERLRPEIAGICANLESGLWISPISLWEILLLAEKRRIDIGDPNVWIRHALASGRFQEAKLNHQIAITSRRLDLPHNDPADRFIAATAVVYDLTLITSDHHLLASKSIRVLANRT